MTVVSLGFGVAHSANSACNSTSVMSCFASIRPARQSQPCGLAAGVPCSVDRGRLLRELALGGRGSEEHRLDVLYRGRQRVGPIEAPRRGVGGHTLFG
ncbi:hypothetical protein [Sphingomonas sp. SAFR-052]|uniref:hypothetical protein n=1 Tax=Sphingomonas sp. SAFR-052 TaxID=3436867 RepID=UPI003F8071B2